MGWSTLSVNADLMDAVSDICYAMTGFQNTWHGSRGTRWFYEIDTIKTDASDDTLFGNVYRESNGWHKGTFQIRSGELIHDKGGGICGIFTMAQFMGKMRYRNIRKSNPSLYKVLAEELKRDGIFSDLTDLYHV
jgi:hypothetical protein